MEDKEVGELWRAWGCGQHPGDEGDVEQLIRKLVEERAASYCYKLPEDTLAMALKDFGINKEEYEQS